MSLKTVNPGDLITSLEWNELVATINSIDLRVASLESGGSRQAPNITQILPPGPVTAGDMISIFGSHFDFVAGGHSVYFGTTRATFFQGKSSDTLLIVRVPDPTAGAVEAGTPMTLTVGNLVSTTTQAITVKAKPVVISVGIQFSFQGTRPTATPTQNQQFFYDFKLISQTSQDLTVTITPDIAVVLPLPPGVSDPGLPGLLTLLDENGVEHPNHQVSLLSGDTKIVSLRLSIPDKTNNLKYTFGASASAPGIESVVETLPQQQVGAAVEQPDATITSFEFFASDDANSEFSTDTGGIPGIDGTLKVVKGRKAIIELEAIFANIPNGMTNHYQITAEVSAPALGWSAVVDASMQNPLPEPGPGGASQIMFDVTAPNSTDTATLKLTLTRQETNQDNKRSVSYRLMTK
jgi:hypothetical protein